MKTVLSVIAFLLVFPFTASAEVIATGGSLRTLIDNIRETIRQTAGPGTNKLVLPTQSQMTRWREALAAMWAGDLDTADQILSALAPSYKVVQFTEDSDGNVYSLLVESDRTDAIVPVVRNGWGTYIFNPLPARLMTIQVPHPVFDADTEAEGIEAFLQLGAQGLFMAGTHRCSNTPESTCAGTTTACSPGQSNPFRVSDVPHNTGTPFHQAHVEVMTEFPDTVVIQLHSNSQAGCPDVLISNTNNPSSVTDGGNVQNIFYNIDTTDITALMCDSSGPDPSQCNLCGKDNVQGRFTNGSSNPCNRSASSPNEQFIHIEQSRAFRQDFSRLINALRLAFPAP